MCMCIKTRTTGILSSSAYAPKIYNFSMNWQIRCNETQYVYELDSVSSLDTSRSNLY